MKSICLSLVLFFSLLISSLCFSQVPILNIYDSPQPKVVAPGLTLPDNSVAAPSDAVILFDGKDLSEWSCKNGEPKWAVHDGMFTVTKGTGDIATKKEFGDFQLHIEFMHPADITGEGQMRGNSGIFLHGLYEIQVLETYNNENRRQNNNHQKGNINIQSFLYSKGIGIIWNVNKTQKFAICNISFDCAGKIWFGGSRFKSECNSEIFT